MTISSTAARVAKSEASHWYTVAGEPMHSVTGKNGKERSATLADARKLNLLPSVTNVQAIIAKPALEAFKVEQACLAVLTTPRKDGEDIDAHVRRVLREERQQDESSRKAAELGTAIHADLAVRKRGPYTNAAIDWLETMGITPLEVETVVVGDGFAGTADLRGELPDGTLCLVDWKTTGKTQKDFDEMLQPWPEHIEQVGAYMTAWLLKLADDGQHSTQARCWVAYIGTKDGGGFRAVEAVGWRRAYERGFLPALTIWQHRKDYVPRMSEETVDEKLDKLGW